MNLTSLEQAPSSLMAMSVTMSVNLVSDITLRTGPSRPRKSGGDEDALGWAVCDLHRIKAACKGLGQAPIRTPSTHGTGSPLTTLSTTKIAHLDVANFVWTGRRRGPFSCRI